MVVIDYPTSWIVEANQDCTSIFKPDGVGVLQISAYEKDNIVTEDELREFIINEVPPALVEELPEEIRNVTIGNLTGLTSEYTDYESSYRWIWLLRDHKRMFFITYVCEFDDWGIDVDLIERLIHGFNSN